MVNTRVRSNAISQRVMKPLGTDVLAAKERLLQVYDDYYHVVVCYSGERDSTVRLELDIEVPCELGKLSVDVLFFAEEVLLPETEEMVRRTRERPEVNLTWAGGLTGMPAATRSPTGPPGARPSGTSG